MIDGRRAIVHAPGAVGLQAFDLPQPGAGEVLLRARRTLISPGTERAFYLDLPNTQAPFPLYPGYSFIGDVLLCGADVAGLQVGERVACTAAHASHALMQARDCHKVPAQLSDERAACFQLLAIAMQAVRKARVELGEAVLVLGAGVVGMLAMRLAQLSGGMPVLGVDVDARRLGIARQVAADVALISSESLEDDVRRSLGGVAPAVVIEATGMPQLVARACQLAAAGGRVVLLGSTRGESDGLNFYRDVHKKGLRIIGGHESARPLHENSPGYWTKHKEQALCLQLLAQGRVEVAPLLTHRYAWRDFALAYEHLAEWDRNALAMLIEWDHSPAAPENGGRA